MVMFHAVSTGENRVLVRGRWKEAKTLTSLFFFV